VSDLVALTGATGFIGGAVARRLARAGWRVRALVRSRAGEAALDAAVEPVQGALEDSDSLRRLVRGAGVIVHCAGAVRGVGPRDFERVNVRGARALARAAGEAMRPARMIVVSSLAARHPGLSPYAASKRAAERVVEGTRAEAVVLRPPAVYGPGDRELRPLLRCMGRGLAPVLGPASARFSLLFVDDLAEAVARLLEVEALAGGIFELHDGHPGGYTWGDVRAAVARWRGGPVRRLPVPAPGLRLLAWANLALARTTGTPPMLTPGKVRELRHPDWVCDNAALTAATGWQPAIDLATGLRRTLGEPPGAPRAGARTESL
jgi:nucleoside-diphosphate-sugar epimerase